MTKTWSSVVAPLLRLFVSILLRFLNRLGDGIAEDVRTGSTSPPGRRWCYQTIAIESIMLLSWNRPKVYSLQSNAQVLLTPIQALVIVGGHEDVGGLWSAESEYPKTSKSWCMTSSSETTGTVLVVCCLVQRRW